MPVLTRVRRRFADVTKLCRGELLGVDGLDDFLGVRARVRAPGLSSRPGMGTSGLEIGPTISASAALRRCGFQRGLGLPRVFRRRPSPAACLEPSGVVSKLVKDPSVVIVRGKTIIGPLAVLPFTSPAAKIKYYDANDLCENSLQFSTNVSISGFLCRKLTSEEYLQNLCRFDQRRSKYT